MSEHIAAEIWIGGEVRQDQVIDLCQVIAAAGVSLEWGDTAFRPQTAQDLLAALKPGPEGQQLLWLCDDHACWGEFEDLEAFLREHGIPYDRHSDGRYEYDPEAEAFRPQGGQVSWLTNHDQRPIVLASGLTPIEAQLTDLLETMKRGEAEAVDVLSQVESIRDCLRAQLPPAVPPLEPFAITDERACPANQEEAQPRDERSEAINRLWAKVEHAGLTCTSLDDLVHDTAAIAASRVNSEGLDAQLGYLIDELGREEAEKEIGRLVESDDPTPVKGDADDEDDFDG